MSTLIVCSEFEVQSSLWKSMCNFLYIFPESPSIKEKYIFSDIFAL